MYFGVRKGFVLKNKNNKRKRGGKKRCVVVNLSLDVLSKMHGLEILCGFIIGLSAEAS